MYSVTGGGEGGHTAAILLHCRKLTHAMLAKPVQFYQKRENVKLYNIYTLHKRQSFRALLKKSGRILWGSSATTYEKHRAKHSPGTYILRQAGALTT